VVFIVLAAGSDDSPSAGSSAPSKPATPDTPQILNDATALDGKYGIEAAVRCGSGADDFLRSVAKFDFKWDDMSFAETKFDKYLKAVVSPGVYTSVSNKAKLQNGFGAFSHIALYCDYDTQAHKVVGYRAESQ
jgi:hypothetical protein